MIWTKDKCQLHAVKTATGPALCQTQHCKSWFKKFTTNIIGWLKHFTSHSLGETIPQQWQKVSLQGFTCIVNVNVPSPSLRLTAGVFPCSTRDESQLAALTEIVRWTKSREAEGSRVKYSDLGTTQSAPVDENDDKQNWPKREHPDYTALDSTQEPSKSSCKLYCVTMNASLSPSRLSSVTSHNWAGKWTVVKFLLYCWSEREAFLCPDLLLA